MTIDAEFGWSGCSARRRGAVGRDLVGEIAEDLSRLLRQEIDLAKAEAKQEVTKLGKGAACSAVPAWPATFCCCSPRSLDAGPGGSWIWTWRPCSSP